MNDMGEQSAAAALLAAAASRWLVKEELAFLLQHHVRLGVPLARQLQRRPPSASLALEYLLRVCSEGTLTCAT